MRSKERLEKRDKALLKRYRQLYDGKKMRNDVVINILADEFYLEPDTVSRVIRQKLV